jgi:uncharacterized protein (DUF488 family)
MPQSNRLNLPSATLKQQIANKISWNDMRSADKADFFTIGYTGKKTEDIIALLKKHEIRTLVDIRQNPISMYRPDLSKNNLARLLQRENIFYSHAPELGVPRDIRAKAIETGSRTVIWTWYDMTVIPEFVNLHTFMNGFEHPIALMCTELDPHECHRHRLCLALERMGLTSFDL